MNVPQKILADGLIGTVVLIHVIYVVVRRIAEGEIGVEEVVQIQMMAIPPRWI